MNNSFLSKTKQTLLLLAVFVLPATAQIPSGYYQTAGGKSGSKLKTALFQIINPHTVLSYGSLWNYYPTTDCVPTNTAQVWDMYSPNVTYFSNHSSMEKEHCVPKSWWNEDDIYATTGSQTSQYTDLFNLYPANADANQAKLNYPLSEIGSTSSFDNASSKVGNSVFAGYTGVAFEPADEYKGDFARTYFYMITCYQNISTWNTYSYCMFTNSTYPGIKPWALSLLLKWSAQDPVSAKEINRNNRVYAIQGNRNPFVDYPEMLTYIWTDSSKTWQASTSALSKTEQDEVRIVFYQDCLNISNPSSISTSYKLLNTQGQIVQSWTSTSSNQNIACGHLPRGVYCLQSQSTVGTHCKKFCR